jgi:predicted nucleotidyltransferase/nicotinamide riboside kinase
MRWASNGVKKFAVIGTSCSGKTTLVYNILSRLKMMGVSCDGVMQQDRRFAFERADLECFKEAQYYFICNQIMRETELTLRGHSEVLVSDRSPLDLYAYYETTYGHSDALFNFVAEWCCKTYADMFYLPPLPYVDDKQRPSDAFRMQVDQTLKGLIPCVEAWGIDIHTEYKRTPQESVFDHILSKVGKKLTGTDLNIIPNVLAVDKVLIGGSYAFNRATKYSDVDVYIERQYKFAPQSTSDCVDKLQSILGVKVQIHFVPDVVVWNYLKGQGFKEILRAQV